MEVKIRPVQFLLVCLSLFTFVSVVRAQVPQVGQLTAPPPIRVIPKAERSQIEEAKDPKARLRLTLDLAESYLTNAERYTAQSNFEAASTAVGIYHALIENGLTYLASLKRDNNKTRDLYKRLELTLREQGPRLTAMRRITPLEFAVWIKQAEDYARNGRTEALNSFYGHTVVREQPKADGEKPDDKLKDPAPPKSEHP